MDGTGAVVVVDWCGWPGRGITTRVRRVSPTGTVDTLVTDIPGSYEWPTVLPNGYLALSSANDVLLLDLGLQPLLPSHGPAGADAAAAAAPSPPPRSVTGDLGALLDAQPDGSSDIAIRVGGRRFHTHRAILSARCDYFKQRLLAPDLDAGGGGGGGGGSGSGFVDARAAELELPDADPDAFALLLRWLYTGAADIPLAQARELAVLADRLLLPDLCTAAQGVVMELVCPATAVDCLLWAARCADARGGAGGCFAPLLERLKGWYVEHHEEVKAEADASRERLVMEAPLMALRLADAVLERASQERGRDPKRRRRT
ncbi:hypothetical protein HXX76_010847 [Chlamydomonas incerta]|uniref:BTB domain-containing protein n=1 Tax=Chlamydomonas incerta TaxID=51695 RepID=A0A835SZF6_CHLIN|nr:hypothetical protein HXX76_010847 [Chlamydomonas incerta]|eukprot:KAG2429615.1 hypothetical protein HXX76_010847 [Chlamydomonas incerta]